MQVRRAGDRFLTRTPGVETRHSFSFGPHWDPTNTAYGPLVTHDEHRLAARAGFPPHPHRGLDVVTCVLEGELVHEDDAGRRVAVREGGVAHLHTGRGVVHAERAGAGGARFVQSWLTADQPGEPTYVSRVLEPAPGLVEAVRVGAAALHVGRLGAGPVELPEAQRRHLFVASGEVEVEVEVASDMARQALAAGDAARLTGARAALHVPAAAVVLVWALDEAD